MAGVAGLPGLPAGMPKVSGMIKPLTDMEKGMVSAVKPMADPLIKPVYSFLTTPLSTMGIKVPREAPTPVGALSFAVKQIEAGKPPIPTKLPGAEMKLLGMPGEGTMFGPPPVEERRREERRREEETTPSPAPTTPSSGTYTPAEEERVLPEEARPGGLVSSLYSLEERRNRMWMSL